MNKRARSERFFDSEDRLDGSSKTPPAPMWGLAGGAALGAIGSIVLVVQCGFSCGGVFGTVVGIAFAIGLGAFVGYCVMVFVGMGLMLLAGIVDWLHRLLFKQSD